MAQVQLASVNLLVAAFAIVGVAQSTSSETFPKEHYRRIVKFKRLVEEEAHQLACLITRETGKTLVRSKAEVDQLLRACDIFSDSVDNAEKAVQVDEVADSRLRVRRAPVGIVCIISQGYNVVADPWWFILPALLCGNGLVWKPANYAAACTERLYELLVEAGFPPGLLSLIYATDDDIALGLEKAYAAHLVDRVCILGSPENEGPLEGFYDKHREISSWENRGKNTIVVLPDAVIGKAAEDSVAASFVAAGQSDDSVGTVFVHQAVHQEFIDRCSATISKQEIGDPMDRVLYGPYGPLRDELSSAAFENFFPLLEPHHRLVGPALPGRVHAKSSYSRFVGKPENGLYYYATIISGVRPEDRIFDAPVAGPVMKVISFEDYEEVTRILSLRPQFSIWLYTQDAQRVSEFGIAAEPDLIGVNALLLDSRQISSSGLNIRLMAPDVAVNWLSRVQAAQLGRIHGSLSWSDELTSMW